MTAALPPALITTDLPLPLVRRGKVRDVYGVDDDRLLLVTTDRISAFDVVMHEAIPYKGAVLTQLTAWWLAQLSGRIAHHLLSADIDAIIREVPVLAPHRAALAGRTGEGSGSGHRQRRDCPGIGQRAPGLDSHRGRPCAGGSGPGRTQSPALGPAQRHGAEQPLVQRFGR